LKGTWFCAAARTASNPSPNHFWGRVTTTDAWVDQCAMGGPALSGGIIAAGLLSGLSNALGSWCLFRALKNGAAASIVIPFTALYPLITVLLAFLFLGETLNLRQCLGAVLAIGGGALLSYEPPA